MELTKSPGWPEQAKSYYEDVKAEMRRVSWPTWPQVRATTGVVIGSVFLFAAYFFVIDAVVRFVVDKIMGAFK